MAGVHKGCYNTASINLWSRSTLSPHFVHYNVKSEIRTPLDTVGQLCPVCALRITKDSVQVNSWIYCYNGYSEVNVFLKLKE